MVILLNGASCTGKTTIAQRLLERYSYTYYSLDHIKMGLYRGLSDSKYNPTNDSVIITENLSPIIEGIIRTALENDQNLVIEGCYFEPESITRIKTEYVEDIILLSLVMSEKYCKKNFNGIINDFRNVTEKRGYDEDRTLNQFIIENNEVLNFSKNNKFQYFEIIEDFETMYKDLIHYLDKNIKI